MRPADERYFERLEARLEEAVSVARAARERGGDPRPEVEIPVAQDMADRVEKVLGIDGVAERVRELEGEMDREEAALELARDFAEGRVGEYETRAGKIEGAVRTAVALLTEGVVAAPIEGIDRVELAENDETASSSDGGTEFVRVFYAGPIRSAGGTAQALSVLVADYVRTLIGLDGYTPREEEVERYAEEVALYDDETGLQYAPKAAETRFVAEHCPIMLDGEPTGNEEVSGYRDLERVDTNSPRGGMCLVLAEGIAQKAPKIKRYTSRLDEVDWPWLDDLIEGTVGDDGGGDAAGEDGDGDGTEDDAGGGGDRNDREGGTGGEDDAGGAALGGPPRVEPQSKFLRDLIAGRPVFSHPSRPGGFRLRYGRARNHGYATAGVHPATMHLVDDFLATGTQIKTERPGKAAGVVPVDTIEGPTVRLASGEVRRIDDPEEARAMRNGVEEILDLGEYLVNYGEFVENNHPLAPASYTVEWWVQDLAAAGADVQAMRDSPHVDLEDPSAEEALEWADEYDAPLHPKYTYLWHDLSPDEFEALAAAVAAGEASDGELLLSNVPDVRRALETLLVEHTREADAVCVPDPLALVRSLGLDADLTKPWDSLSGAAREWPNAMRAVDEVAPFAVQERAPTRIGNRMGRPEKSEKRELNPAVHTLFPLGEAGGDQRDVARAAAHTASRSDAPGQVEVEVARRECAECDAATYRPECPDCGSRTEPRYECPGCERVVELDESGRAECPRCGREASAVERRVVNVRAEYHRALDAAGERESAFDVLKGVKGLTSERKTPEPMAKGVLRAKHGVSAFKDGTVRYDMTDLPVTSVRPAELDVTAETFRELGYETDVHGEPLRHDDQLVELEVQDVVLSDGAAEHLLKTADFVDDLLARYYGLEPFYGFDGRDDLVGELVFGMAPHTSAAVIGRVIGFTTAAVGYAHPYFHAAKRRNCFHPETNVRFQDEDGEWRYDTIASLVEERLDDPREDAFGTLIQELDGGVRVPSLDSEGTPVSKPVEAVSKHPSPEHLIEIETRSGRTLSVTPEHTMLRWDGTVERVDARSIRDGDVLPTPRAIEFEGETATFDPLAEFLASERIADGIGFDPERTDATLREAHESVGRTQRLLGDGGDIRFDEVTRVDVVASDVEYTYCLTVEDTHALVANDLYVGQCDGDEDCVMLLMDGLLNFSREYLPDKRGGRMDAPLVMTSRIDPTEIDDEAHNVDVVERYPREFYEATRRMADPDEVDIRTAEATLGTDRECSGFRHTHDTSDIAAGPDLSAYKTLGSMMEKMDAQLELARKLRAVDETDVAERVIEYHFLPDLLGNLRAFARQETRCLDCGEKYRRMPLSGDCRLCGGDVTLTVHEGSVDKYMDTAIRVAEEFGAREYTKQRLELLRRSLESIFENDKNKATTLGEFM